MFVRNTQFALYSHFKDWEHTLREISSFPLVLFLPYCFSNMKFAELYAMGVPLVAPSLEFLLDLEDKIHGQNGSMIEYSDRGFEAAMREDSEQVWNSSRLDIWRWLPPTNRLPNNNPQRMNIPAPWDRSSRAWWMSLIEIYQHPYVQYFSSMEQLTSIFVKNLGYALSICTCVWLSEGMSRVFVQGPSRSNSKTAQPQLIDEAASCRATS